MKELFAASRGSLGDRTVMKNLREEGFEVGRDHTRRLMKALNLKVKQKRQYRVTTDMRHSFPVAANLLNHQFSPQAPNQIWGADLSVDPGRLDLLGVNDGDQSAGTHL